MPRFVGTPCPKSNHIIKLSAVTPLSVDEDPHQLQESAFSTLCVTRMRGSFFRRKHRDSGKSTASQTASPLFAVDKDEDLVYTAPTGALPSGPHLAHSVGPSGILKIRRVNRTCPGFVPAPLCICLEYDIPSGVQETYHPHPGNSYPSTYRYVYLPNDDSGCRLLARFKIAWLYGYMFCIGHSQTLGLDDQVTFSTIPQKTSLHGGEFGFPDPFYISKANTELDRLGIPPDGECLALLSRHHSQKGPAVSAAATLPASVPLPPALNPSFIPPGSMMQTPTAAASLANLAPAAPVMNPTALIAAARTPVVPSVPVLPAGSVLKPALSTTVLGVSSSTHVVFEKIWYSAPNSLACAITCEHFEPVSGDDECAICLDKVSREASVKIKACQHEFHVTCLKDSLSHNPRCPVCRQPIEHVQGKSPSGTMNVEASDEDCPGFGPGVKAIRITYDIPSGVQKDYHENPNQSFEGTTRVAYLPDNAEGKDLLKRLKYAWKHGLIFRIGRSLTTGRSNQVTWTSIHHKTSLWGCVILYSRVSNFFFGRILTFASSFGTPAAPMDILMPHI